MKKKVLALIICLFMLAPIFSSCADSNMEDIGAYITMFLTDEIYDFDPANAYYNEQTKDVVSLLFATLFKLNSNGKVEKYLAKSYSIVEDKETDTYQMIIKLKETCWSNGTTLLAEDVCYAWKRLVNPANNFEAASLLYDIKNARAIKYGDVTIDSLGVEAVGQDTLRITFEGKIDYEEFIKNSLTSLATAPLPEDYVKKGEDWAKKSSTMITSGPFKLARVKYEKLDDALRIEDKHYTLDADTVYPADYGSINSKTGTSFVYTQKVSYFYLDRNTYYMRDTEHDSIDKYVSVARILVDCSKTDTEIIEDYKNGLIHYVGNIPLSIRNSEEYADLLEDVEVTDALSTFVAYINEDADILTDSGEKLFSITAVRKALSLALDRNAIAEAVVYAKPATALVPSGISDLGKTSKDFREIGGNLISTSANLDEAKQLLSDAGIVASKYSFTVKVAYNDDVQCKMAEMIVEAWNQLGFNVTLTYAHTITNNDYFEETFSYPVDICDDQLTEALKNKEFDVILYDYSAYSCDAYSMLSNFALDFSGMGIDAENENYDLVSNYSGYNSEKYNTIMEAVYYLPYFKNLNRDTDYDFLGGIYETLEEFQAVYDKVKAVYDEYGITPSSKANDWDKQKSTLLHAAESILVKDDAAIIPVVFNQNASLVSKNLTNIKGTYYIPNDFTKAKLKGYENYYYVIETVGWLVAPSYDEYGNITVNGVKTSTYKTKTVYDNFPDYQEDYDAYYGVGTIVNDRTVE